MTGVAARQWSWGAVRGRSVPAARGSGTEFGAFLPGSGHFTQLPAEKSTEPVGAGAPLAELTCCALMGTVVRSGSGTGVVVATGGAAEFGRIALGLGERQPETEFQVGLRKFSMLLVQVAGASRDRRLLPGSDRVRQILVLPARRRSGQARAAPAHSWPPRAAARGQVHCADLARPHRFHDKQAARWC